MTKEMQEHKGEIIIYKTEDGQTAIDVRLQEDTVWLTQKQIATLFGTQRPAITTHLGNIFNNKELREDSVSSILEHTARDGKTYRTKFYNLDAILSLGYRVNSPRATRFRKLNDNALVALTLLVAESNPKQKDVMIKLIINLISGR